MISKILSIVFATALSTVAVVAQNNQSASLSQFETTCLGVEEDGSQTVRAWGLGRNKRDAVDQAKKNAVRDVIFSGIRSGADGCNMRPLLNEVNARERHEDYFNKFFKDGGEYKKYVSDADEKRHSKDKKVNSINVRYGVTLRVMRTQLKEHLQKDGLIK